MAGYQRNGNGVSREIRWQAPEGVRVRRSRRRERGQSLVELALVLPVFLLIVMATIDFGWALRSYIVITNSAREGARAGVVGASEDDIKAAVVEKSAGLLTEAEVTVTNAQTEPGTNLSVAVEYEHNYISPLGGFIDLVSGGSVPDPLPISSTTTMRME
jgi:Flp pilus assembly protein TadG